MLFNCPSISALAAITFLTQATTSVAGHARPRGHRHGARMVPFADFNSEPIGRRAAPGITEIPTGQLQMLQSEIASFQSWMGTFIDTAPSIDKVAAIAQLKQEFEAFDGWMTAFLANVMGTGPSTLPALSHAVPVTVAPASSVLAALSAKPEVSVIAELSSSLPLPKITSSPALPSSTAVEAGSTPLAIGVAPSSSAPASSVAAQALWVQPISSKSASSANITSTVPASSAPVSSVHVASTSAAATVSSAPSTPSGGSGGSFNAASSSNLAVYYGQTDATGQVTLAQMCQDPNVDIVILAFLSTFFGPGGYPTLNLGSACNGPSSAQSAKGATGMLGCPTVAQDIKTCQGLGKKVLLSLGGAVGSTAFSGTSQANTFATRLWDLFGAGTGETLEMKPFGDVKVDGFDVGTVTLSITKSNIHNVVANLHLISDNEDHSTAFYSDFVSSLRTTMNADASKKYYISAAPQCPRPDESIPLDAMQSMDFVFVQFYNNGPCNIGQSGFVDSLKAWSGDLSAKGSGPKLYIGAPGCPTCAGSGYADPAAMATAIASAKSAVSNFGGVMLWDGPEAKQNTAGGQDYLQVVKSAMV